MGTDGIVTGARVLVRESCAKKLLRGLLGTVTVVYRSSRGVAVHVRVDDGRWQLFRSQDLERLELGEQDIR